VRFVAVTVFLGGGAAGLLVWRQRREDEEELIELAPVAGPTQFRHPYEDWPLHQKAWFAVKRTVFLAWAFAPFAFASVFVLLSPSNTAWREYWLDEMLRCTNRAGAAFQKFGQWLSMRPDMFPPDVIEVLSCLRSTAPSHTSAESRQILQKDLGREVEELFEAFEDKPVASGSVGQVHKARLRAEFALDGKGGKLRDVAVKVQHPGVVDSAFMDIAIVWKIVDFSERFLHMAAPFSRYEFEEVIRAQMDFTREAFNLQKFGENFKTERRTIRFPKVSAKYVTRDVLVETWAEGTLISKILEDFDNATPSSVASGLSELKRKKRDLQQRLCAILYDMNMKMMIRDNFVHGDLHGGNILYSDAGDHVTVLDAGIATSLHQESIAPFCRFLKAFCSGGTDVTVEYLNYFNEAKAKVNADIFKPDIQAIMDKFMGPTSRKDPNEPVNAADMFGEVMFALQRHGLRLKGDVACTLFTISISEGLVRQLDPTYDVAKRAIPYILKYAPTAAFASE